jgi:hypothetical protein
MWESLAAQAVDRCEYVLSWEMLQQALSRGASPPKGKLMLALAEVSLVLGEREAAARWGEKAFALIPHSAELRNLLLTVAPDKWAEKMRTVSAAAPSSAASSSISSPPASKLVKVPDPSEDNTTADKETKDKDKDHSSWLNKMKTKASETITVCMYNA